MFSWHPLTQNPRLSPHHKRSLKPRLCQRLRLKQRHSQRWIISSVACVHLIPLVQAQGYRRSYSYSYRTSGRSGNIGSAGVAASGSAGSMLRSMGQTARAAVASIPAGVTVSGSAGLGSGGLTLTGSAGLTSSSSMGQSAGGMYSMGAIGGGVVPPTVLPAPLPAPGPAPAPGWAASGQCGGMMDQCCNMANEGCCTGPEQGQRWVSG